VAAHVLMNKLEGKIEGIRASEVKERLETSSAGFQLLDVRESSEVKEKRIPGSIWIPLGELGKRTGELDKTKEVAVHCESGLRSYKACLKLKHAGIENVKNVDGGMLCWCYDLESGEKTEKDKGEHWKKAYFLIFQNGLYYGWKLTIAYSLPYPKGSVLEGYWDVDTPYRNPWDKESAKMRGKEFLKSLANGQADIIQILLDIIAEKASPYCVIGGLAVNAYVEPVVSLDVDIVIAVKDVEAACRAAERRRLKVEPFEHSLNIHSPQSDLRIQLQTDPRYQEFISRAELRDVLGYKMYVASLEDVLQGKVWAYADQARRRSKRQKDLADILRIIEKYPRLKRKLPPSLQEELEKE
jgi:rhodanese-related sulfurtransferase